MIRPSEASRKWDELPAGQRHPKNLAQLAVKGIALPGDCHAIVLQDVDYRHPKVTVEVEIPGGPVCEVEVLASDDPDSLAARIRGAGEMCRRQVASERKGAMIDGIADLAGFEEDREQA